jgi:2-keto-4-pentenoate hydratase
MDMERGVKVSQPESEARTIADVFVKARRAAQALADYPGTPPKALGEAYVLQDAAISLFGGTIAGWKVGRINPPWLEQLGTSRLAGPIFSHSIQSAANGHIPTGEIFNEGFGAAEAEFVFRVGTAPAAGQTRFTIDDGAALIDTVYCGIEIASSPFPGINELGPLVTISDFGNNNGLLLGPEIPDWRASGLVDWEVATSIDGALVGTGAAKSFPGGPLESVRFLIENLVGRGIPVTPGLLISSGAVTGVHEVVRGQSVEARFGDYCSMHCSIRHATGLDTMGREV